MVAVMNVIVGTDVVAEDGYHGVDLGWKAVWIQDQLVVMLMQGCEDHLDSG